MSVCVCVCVCVWVFYVGIFPNVCTHVTGHADHLRRVKPSYQLWQHVDSAQIRLTSTRSWTPPPGDALVSGSCCLWVLSRQLYHDRCGQAEDEVQLQQHGFAAETSHSLQGPFSGQDKKAVKSVCLDGRREKRRVFFKSFTFISVSFWTNGRFRKRLFILLVYLLAALKACVGHPTAG